MLEALQLHAVGWLTQPAEDEGHKSLLPFLAGFFFFSWPSHLFEGVDKIRQFKSIEFSISLLLWYQLTSKSAGNSEVIAVLNNITLIFLLGLTEISEILPLRKLTKILYIQYICW